MNYTIKKHKLLKILAPHNINVQSGLINSPLGISFEDIHKKLNVTHEQLLTISSELFDLKEIGYHNAHNVEGLYAEEKGISAYSTKKYLKQYRKSIIDNIKDIIQIVIPVISVIIAYLAITLKIETFNKKNEEQINTLEKRLKIIENLKTNPSKLKANGRRNNLY